MTPEAQAKWQAVWHWWKTQFDQSRKRVDKIFKELKHDQSSEVHRDLPHDGEDDHG